MSSCLSLPGSLRTTRLRTTLATLVVALTFLLTVGPWPQSALVAQEVEEFPAKEVGEASWYGPKFHGKTTANGERYDQDGLTAAHLTLPFDTLVRVRHLANGRSVDVRINDRGPYAKGRILDLSRGAAKRLSMVNEGVGRVEISLLELPAAERLGYRLQFGAFRNRQHAEQLLDRLVAHAPGANVYSEGDWHRVQLHFTRRSPARSMSLRLQNLGFGAILLENSRR